MVLCQLQLGPQAIQDPLPDCFACPDHFGLANYRTGKISKAPIGQCVGGKLIEYRASR